MKWHVALGLAFSGFILLVISVVQLNETTRMERFDLGFNSRQIEVGADLYENNCRSCHGPQGEGSPLAPALNEPAFFNGTRLANIAYTGTLEDYVRGVIMAGRPVPSEGTNYPQRMPTWSQRNGGPLRDDQVESVVAFVLNWETEALSAEGGEIVGVPEDLFGTDIQQALPAGDADAGKTLAEGVLGCAACHLLSEGGPAWEASGTEPGIASRAETRFEQDDYTGNAANATEYLLESIIATNLYIVPGFEPNIMPNNYGQRISIQEMADIIAYLETFR
jgi:mono/diheme cytochrome c family protein